MGIFPIGAYSAAIALPSRVENVGEAKSGSQPTLTVGKKRIVKQPLRGGEVRPLRGCEVRPRSDLSGGGGER